MFTSRTILVYCFLVVNVIHLGQGCGPAEIGKEFTITSTHRASYGRTVMWQVGRVPVYASERDYPNLYPQTYNGTRTRLTIKNVTKNDAAVYRHIVDADGQVGSSRTVYTCTLQVYRRATTPTCETLKVWDDALSTNCSTSEVYPEAKCYFYLRRYRGGKHKLDIYYNSNYITYKHNDPTPSHAYNSTTCVLKFPVSGLKPSAWGVQVRMYPNVTGLSSSRHTVGQSTNTISLTLPTVTINNTACPKGLVGEGDTNVRHGYIRQGEQATCECTRVNAGNPPGSVQWTKSGNILRNGDREATVTIDSEGTYKCESVSVLDGSPSVAHYTPSYAYGPDNVLVTLSTSGPLYLCDGKSPKVTVNCLVRGNVNPYPLFTIRDSTNTVLVNKQSRMRPRWDLSESSIRFTFATPGEHRFTCRAENGAFDDIYHEAQSDVIKMYTPPQSPPTFQVTGPAVKKTLHEIWVKKGSNISVTCTAGDGAYPPVSSGTVTCGGQTSSNGQFSVTREGLTCQCAVNHETSARCNAFNLNKVISVKSAYGPYRISMALTNNRNKKLPAKPIDICGSETIEISVCCGVDTTTTRPLLNFQDFTLIKPDSMIILKRQISISSSQHTYEAVFKLNISTVGNHSFVCEARNPTFPEIKQRQSRTLQVRRPPMAPKISAQSLQHDKVLVIGDDVIVTCVVLSGKTGVKSVTLTCIGNTKKRDTAAQTLTMTRSSHVVFLVLQSIGVVDNMTHCSCRVLHVVQCFNKTGALQLNVQEKFHGPIAQNGECQVTEGDLVGAVVGTFVGTLCLGAIIAGAVFYIRKKKPKLWKKGRSKEYDQVERRPNAYQNVVIPGEPNYMTVNLPDRRPNNASKPNYENTDIPGQNEHELQTVPQDHQISRVQKNQAVNSEA